MAWVLIAFIAVYSIDIGHGFIKDDFSWILHRPTTLTAAFTDTPMGFFRPLVALSFELNERLFGLAPAPYAWTNLLCAAAIAVLVAATTASLGFGRLGGAFAAGLWAFNFHGINMALLWTSGRTSLVGALGAAAAALAFSRARYRLAGVCVLAALLGKEEPLLLPVVFAAWAILDARAESRALAAAALRAAWPSFLAVAVYFVLRSRTDAFTPATAPDVYQLHAGAVIANAVQYLDRALTFTAAVVGLAWLVFSRHRLRTDELERRTIAKGLVWLVLGFALTIMIASRSSLYAVYPSIGAALVGVAVGRALWRTIPDARRGTACAAALALPLVLWPVYHARNQRLKNEGALSTTLLARVERELTLRPSLARIVVYDDPAARPSAASALGETLPDAVFLTTGRHMPALIVPVSPPAFPERDGDNETLELLVAEGAVKAR